MRLQRLVVGVLGAALLGAVPVALTTTSAEAGAAVTTRVKLRQAGQVVYKYGTKIVDQPAPVEALVECRRRVRATCGRRTSPATVITLQRRMAGATKWKTIATDSTTAVFTLHHRSKGVAASTRSSTAVAPTADDQLRSDREGPRRHQGLAQPAQQGRQVRRRLYYRGNVDPGWGRKPVTIQKKNCKSCGWHAYKTVRTSRTGGYSARDLRAVQRPLVLPLDRAGHQADASCKATGGTIYTYRARTARGAGAGIGG